MARRLVSTKPRLWGQGASHALRLANEACAWQCIAPRLFGQSCFIRQGAALAEAAELNSHEERAPENARRVPPVQAGARVQHCAGQTLDLVEHAQTPLHYEAQFPSSAAG